ncbi:MAG TPA: PspA/IM30 family protein [Pseudomonadales bacterium]|nr:PspA/IM30 family protein [Pseudomonadales bacterium]
MSIWKKLVTAIKGHVSEAGQAVVDANVITILDQEIRDADAELRKSKDSLASLMAKQKIAQDKLTNKQDKLAEYGGYIQQALAKGDETLAKEVAEKYAQLENEMADEKALVADYDTNISNLKRLVSQTETRLKQLRTKVDTVKAKEHVIRASSAIADAHAGSDSKMRTALESFERLQHSQAEKMARIEAADQLARENDGSDLEERLKKAGIMPAAKQADDVLARFRKP